MYLQLASFSGVPFLGGLGKLRMTSLASWDLATITSLSLTAVCIERTFEDSLPFDCAVGTDKEGPVASGSSFEGDFPFPEVPRLPLPVLASGSARLLSMTVSSGFLRLTIFSTSMSLAFLSV